MEFTKVIDYNKKSNQILMHTFCRFKIYNFSLLLITDSQRTNTQIQNVKAQSLDSHINPLFLRIEKAFQLSKHSKR